MLQSTQKQKALTLINYNIFTIQIKKTAILFLCNINYDSFSFITDETKDMLVTYLWSKMFSHCLHFWLLCGVHKTGLIVGYKGRQKYGDSLVNIKVMMFSY